MQEPRAALQQAPAAPRCAALAAPDPPAPPSPCAPLRAQEQTREQRLLQARRLVDSFGSTRRRRQLNEREAGRLQAGQLTSGDALVSMIGTATAAAAASGARLPPCPPAVDDAARGEAATGTRPASRQPPAASRLGPAHVLGRPPAPTPRPNTPPPPAGMTRDDVLARAAQQRNIPPHNPAAAAGEQAYSMYKLVPGGQLGVLRAGSILKLAEDRAALATAREKRFVSRRRAALQRPGPAALFSAAAGMLGAGWPFAWAPCRCCWWHLSPATRHAPRATRHAPPAVRHAPHPAPLPPPPPAQHPAYVLERAAALSKLVAADKESAKRRAACLAFLSCLLRLYASAKVLRADPAKGGVAALARQMGAVEELAEGLLERFYSAE